MSGQYIENPEAYERGIQRNIRRNSVIGRRKRWLAIEGNQELFDWLKGRGKFEGTEVPEDTDGIIGYTPHPLCIEMFSGSFGRVLFDLRDSLEAWGGLTEAQTVVVRGAFNRAKGWADDREKKATERKKADAKSSYIGSVKERRFFDLIVNKILSFEGVYGTVFINICHEVENVVIYKGSNEFGSWMENGEWENAEGKTICVKATIKDHNEREGVKQTIISRPKVLEVA